VSVPIDPAMLWPLALVIAVTLVVDRARAARRRARLNRALHELRRPLQSLALTATSQREPADATSHPDSLDLVLVALGDLDGAINGAPPRLERTCVHVRSLVDAAIDRWRGAAAGSGRALRLGWHANNAAVLADAARIAQALDNLIANAIEHGGILIGIEVRLHEGTVRIAVRDGGPARVAGKPSHGRDGRRGHGLAIAAGIAAAHGGRLLFERGHGGSIACLELPLAPPPAELAAGPTSGRPRPEASGSSAVA
jgi:two-component system OmpR family sensor kinase